MNSNDINNGNLNKEEATWENWRESQDSNPWSIPTNEEILRSRFLSPNRSNLIDSRFWDSLVPPILRDPTPETFDIPMHQEISKFLDVRELESSLRDDDSWFRTSTGRGCESPPPNMPWLYRYCLHYKAPKETSENQVDGNSPRTNMNSQLLCSSVKTSKKSFESPSKSVSEYTEIINKLEGSQKEILNEKNRLSSELEKEKEKSFQISIQMFTAGVDIAKYTALQTEQKREIHELKHERDSLVNGMQEIDRQFTAEKEKLEELRKEIKELQEASTATEKTADSLLKDIGEGKFSDDNQHEFDQLKCDYNQLVLESIEYHDTVHRLKNEVLNLQLERLRRHY